MAETVGDKDRRIRPQVWIRHHPAGTTPGDGEGLPEEGRHSTTGHVFAIDDEEVLVALTQDLPQDAIAGPSVRIKRSAITSMTTLVPGDPWPPPPAPGQ